ncbi:MAG: radical SAM protein [Nitrospirae bacterium]|nr:radical SAM protein [Nitrospirota bacterium]
MDYKLKSIEIIKLFKPIIPNYAWQRIKKLKWVKHFIESGSNVSNLFDFKTSRYHCEIPPLKVKPNLDFLVLELPPRYMPLMPNGLGYLYNILQKCDLSFQILDVNISLYHMYHEHRLRNKLSNIYTPSGYLLPDDPWDNTSTALWSKEEIISYFWPEILKLTDKIAANPPKTLGISLNGFNRNLAKKFVKEIRRRLPDVVIIVGGYDCVHYNLGPSLFSDFDYMVIGEAELTLPPLMKSLREGNRPKDLPGIVSRFDSSDRQWTTLLLENLDDIEWPKYQWIKVNWYQTYDRHHLIPITGGRGCLWSRCKFCSERFYFRKRDPAKIVDEIEYFTKSGYHSFHFNESDVNGDQQNLYNICNEILRRKLEVKLAGQLRIDRRNTPEYFIHMAKAGFTHLRFGVDGWNDRLLILMNKGYNMDLVFQNLRDCHNAGIVTTVNVVIGVPGETESDVDECINNFIKCKDFIHAVESFNTLLLACGSEYYTNPDQYKIKFRWNKEEIYDRFADYIPTELWYSEDPYIDQEIRLSRLNRILSTLYLNGVQIGPFATKVIERLKNRESESNFKP